MSGILSNAGLISGLPVQDIIDSLMAIQRQPVTLLQSRLSDIGNRRAAFLQISAKLLSVQNSIAKLNSASSFARASAVGSNDSVLLATAGSTAAPGTYSFTVRNLAAAHQVLSAGFTTADSTPVGAGTITLERADALVNRSTRLGALNGQAGVQLGRIRITDRSGASAEFDLVGAQTVDDVVRIINQPGAIQVQATVSGDSLRLVDSTGLATGTLSVVEVSGGRTAADLGILATSATGEIFGTSLTRLSESTQLSFLNDGNGIRHLTGQNDISVSLADGSTLEFSLSERVDAATALSALNRGSGVAPGSIHFTLRDGTELDVDLSGATTLGDVETAIEGASGNLSVTYSGSKLVLTDTSTGDGSTKVEEVAGGATAAALGLLGESASGTITGKKIYFVETLGDVLRIFNTQSGNTGQLTAALSADGTGIVLNDQTTGAAAFAVTALNGSQAAEDLGIDGPATGAASSSRRLVAGLNTTLLRSLSGGSGIETGVVQITDKSGASANVDLTAVQTLAEVIDAINAAGLGVTASVSANGLGVTMTDTTGGSGDLIVSDLSGQAAAQLGIAGTASGATINGGNLQKQYVSAATRLADFNHGAGVVRGKFRITESAGQSAVVDLTQGNEETLQDVINEINSRGIGVTARINDHGDGLLIEDTTGGAGSLKISEEGGTTAASLRILGEAAAGTNYIDGTFEARITLSATDSLQTLVQKIQAAQGPAQATIINDGSAGRPYRLSLMSSVSGLDGALAIDVGTTGLNFSTLTQARDATVVFGAEDAGQPLVFSSSSNTFDYTVEGIRLDLVGTSASPVSVTVSRDTDSIVKDVSAFVTAFNAAISAIDDLTKYDTESQTGSVLSGDATARRVRDRLLNFANKSIATGSSVTRLSQLGITVGANASLQFDEEKFRNAIGADDAAVSGFFAEPESGFAQFVADEITRLTESDTGVISIEDEALSASADLLASRIEQLETLLDRRRERLVVQFNAMESAIAQLQSQQSALAALTLLPIQ